jgi:hypothetical protein
MKVDILMIHLFDDPYIYESSAEFKDDQGRVKDYSIVGQAPICVLIGGKINCITFVIHYCSNIYAN